MLNYMKLNCPGLIIVFSLFFLLLSARTSLARLCSDEQQSLILQFKHDSFSESSPSKLATWKPDTDCCSWKGVECDHATGLVISLNLTTSGLFYGQIDSNTSLFRLGSLLRLDLSGVLFGSSTGQLDSNYSGDVSVRMTEDGASSSSPPILIPLGFSRLENLTHLNLATSGFSGQVPQEMSLMTKLVSLDLSYNELELQNPNLRMIIQNMSSLRELRLDGIDMSSQNNDWCETISSSLPTLHVLSLSGCSLPGPICSDLSNLHQLREINLGNNNLSSAVPESLANLPSLQSIDLGYCGLQGEFPRGILKLASLQKVELSFNPDLVGLFPDFPQESALQELSLSFTKFYGKLPDSLGNLKHLTSLFLENGNFSGKIPTSISKLTKLSFLSLSSNKFSGSIPSLVSPNHTFGLVSLRYLSFQNNLLDGEIDSSLFRLPLLQYLSLSQNRFNGLPKEVGNKPCPFLSQLDLRDNLLQGLAPKFLSALKSLEQIFLSSNNMSGTVNLEMFSNLKNLSFLDLSDNPWTVTSTANLTFDKLEKLEMRSCRIQEFPGFLRNIPQLDFLDLSRNQIKGQVPNWIWKSSLSYLNLSLNLLTGLVQPLPVASSLSLISLDLHSNKLEGSIPLVSQNPTFLDYSDNKFTSIIPVDIDSYVLNATFFSASGNKLVGEIPRSLCRANRLEVLDLSNNSFHGTIPSCLGDFSASLSVLSLGGNDLQGTMPRTYASNLRTLVFNGNRLQGTVPRSLSACKLLEVLDLGNNQIDDTFPFWLENLPSLRVLVLRSNKFHGSIGLTRTKNPFSMLHVLDISSNGFTGHLPSQSFHKWKAMMNPDHEKSQSRYLGSKYYHDSVTVTMKGRDMLLVRILTIFSSLDLSKNDFKGEIPESIGDLKALHVLNMSRNNLDGHIPTSIQQLHQLESLDLSENKLVGEIPGQLTSLTFLAVLNLAWNELRGHIPRGRQFDTFSALAYEGNPELCGFPLSRQCQRSSEPLQPLHLDSESSFEWKFVAMGYGCGLVAGISIGYMLVRRDNGWFSTLITKCQQRNRRRRNKIH